MALLVSYLCLCCSVKCFDSKFFQKLFICKVATWYLNRRITNSFVTDSRIHRIILKYTTAIFLLTSVSAKFHHPQLHQNKFNDNLSLNTMVLYISYALQTIQFFPKNEHTFVSQCVDDLHGIPSNIVLLNLYSKKLLFFFLL